MKMIKRCPENKICVTSCKNYDGRYCKLKYNSPEEFDDLPREKQDAIISWVEGNIPQRKTINHKISSYGLKHICEQAVGFYVSNGEMKGAMLKAGFVAGNRRRINWSFNISQKFLRGLYRA
jgi:hypothetical protein